MKYTLMQLAGLVGGTVALTGLLGPWGLLLGVSVDAVYLGLAGDA